MADRTSEQSRLESIIADLRTAQESRSLNAGEAALLERAQLRLEGLPRSQEDASPEVRVARARRRSIFEAEAERLFPKTEEEKAAEQKAKADAKAAEIEEQRKQRSAEAMRRLQQTLASAQGRVLTTGIDHHDISAHHYNLWGVLDTYFEGRSLQEGGRALDYRLRLSRNPLQSHLDRLERRTR